MRRASSKLNRCIGAIVRRTAIGRCADDVASSSPPWHSGGRARMAAIGLTVVTHCSTERIRGVAGEWCMACQNTPDRVRDSPTPLSNPAR